MHRIGTRVGRRGFSLIELMMVVALVGVLAALAIYGVRRYLLHAKTTEARNSLGQLAKDAETAYQRENMAAAVLAAKGKVSGLNLLCTTASQAVPNATSLVQGKKYQSRPTDWQRDVATANRGFACLHFGMSDAQYYRYNYVRTTTAVFTGSANGDLDGNGVTSTFEVFGSVNAGHIFVSPNFREVTPEE